MMSTVKGNCVNVSMFAIDAGADDINFFLNPMLFRQKVVHPFDTMVQR